MKRTVIAFLLVVAAVCALPWTPLWDVVLDVGYGPLCLLGVDRWFSASETLVLLNETGADFSNAANPARKKEVERVESLCGANLAFLVIVSMLVPSCQIVRQEQQLEMRRAFVTKMGIDVPEGWGIATNQTFSFTNAGDKSRQ